MLLAALDAVTTSAKPMPNPDHWREAIRAAVDGSATMVTWALSAIGGSIIAIVSTSYWRPADVRVRSIYLLFFPAWIVLARSMYLGDKIARRNIAARFVSPDMLQEIARGLNLDYMNQQTSLSIGLSFLGLWLACYLLWWIYGEWTTNKEGK